MKSIPQYTDPGTDLSRYRGREREQLRARDLVSLMPTSGRRALDVGARDGHYARLLSDRFEHVTALDLQQPVIEGENIDCVAGDVTKLNFADGHFDFVLCAQVLEHIPRVQLQGACDELGRVSRKYLLVGVPYKQDIRAGRSTCSVCGGKNPPWGHVNRFDERTLTALFPAFRVQRISYVDHIHDSTNFLSTWLMDLAGNPEGTYQQEEPCIHCNAKLLPPGKQAFPRRVAGKAAVLSRKMLAPFKRSHPIWIHVLFAKRTF